MQGQPSISSCVFASCDAAAVFEILELIFNVIGLVLACIDKKDSGSNHADHDQGIDNRQLQSVAAYAHLLRLKPSQSGLPDSFLKRLSDSAPHYLCIAASTSSTL